MQKDEIKEIRNYIACPQFGDDHYGKWGALRLDQRLKIKSLLDYITNLQKSQETLIKNDNEIITNLQEENKVLLEKYSTIQILYNSSKSSIDETVKYLKIQIDDYKEELQKIEDEDVKLFCIHKIDTYNELLNILQNGGDK